MKPRLASAIHNLANRSYIGYILQSLRIYQDDSCPSMGVRANPKTKTLVMVYNSKFMDTLTDTELEAVLTHEMRHIINKHVYFYPGLKYDRRRMNFAMDIQINQYITGLPKSALSYEHFKDKDGKQFPKGMPTETYYDLLMDAEYDNPDAKPGEGEPADFLKPGKNNGPAQQGEGNEPGKGGGPQLLDEHYWEDCDAEQVADLLKRANIVHEKRKGRGSSEIEELIDAISKTIKDLNYNKIMLHALKASMPGTDIYKSYTRPSRRYGTQAKGNVRLPLPKIKKYIDTSGSIGQQEIEDVANILHNFFKVGVSAVEVGFFHSSLYKNVKYNNPKQLAKEGLQSGGTDLTEVFEDISKNHSDLFIILTDGYYDGFQFDLKGKRVVFLINADKGCADHPLKHLGKTFLYKA